MSLWRQLTRGMRRLVNPGAADRDIAEEVQRFFDDAAAEYAARGLSPDDARRAARLQLGSATAATDEVRDYGWEHLIDTALADLRMGGRMLRKSPVFTVVAVLCISLGSGAVTTIFSAMNALVLRPLPAATDAARLVRIERKNADATSGLGASYPYYQYLARRSRALDGLAAWGKITLTLAPGAGEGVAAYGNFVSGNFFSVLGVRPVLGRFFAADEDTTERTHPVLVVSELFWRSRLAADPEAVGRTLAVNGHPFTLIGVAPAALVGLDAPIRTDAWVPLMMRAQLQPNGGELTDASNTWLRLCGRLRDGISHDAARRELSALTAARAAEGTEPNWFSTHANVQLSMLTGLPSDASRPVLGFLGLLLGAAGLVLLIASVNVASMLSARAVARRREMAVRAALGAARMRLVRQLLTEIAVLFLAGAVGGITVATVATRALEQVSITQTLPVALSLTPDLRVLAFALAVSLAAGLAFGLAPALRATHADITLRLRDGSTTGSTRRGLISSGLVVGQLGLSLTLLVAAGLFLRALDRGARADPGFDAQGVVVAAFNPESWGYDETRGRRFFSTLGQHLALLPGVTAVAYATYLPLTAQSPGDLIRVEGEAEHPIKFVMIDANYFTAIRLPIVLGRAIERSDDESRPKVAVINEFFARRFWPDGSAIGRTFRFRDQQVTIVGVAHDAKYSTLTEDASAFVYFPVAQFWTPGQTLLVRSSASLPETSIAIAQAVRSIDPTLPRPVVTTLQQENAIVLLPQRVAAIVTGALGALGLLLATVGLYGIVAYSAGRRTREIAIRVAVGARRADVLGLVAWDGARLAALGVVLGLLLASALTRLLAAYLFGVSPLDTIAFVEMSALFVVTALVASYLPARRAAAADPVSVLRAE